MKEEALKKQRKSLYRQFLPLSLSDVAMALGDPLQTAALSRLANAPAIIAGAGIVKALAIFLESPVIMLLHASTALSKRRQSILALWRFMLIISASLTLIFLFLSWPPLYNWLFLNLFGATAEMADFARPAFLLMLLWPAAIAWRRFFQGLLIRNGRSGLVGYASIARLIWIITSLIVGVYLEFGGGILAGLTMVGGVLLEATIVTLFAKDLWKNIRRNQEDPFNNETGLPVTLRETFVFYAPLASTMLVVWGGRAALLGIVGHAADGLIALAVWPASWGLVLSVANATRMVQQVVICESKERGHQHLLEFVLIVGLVCSAFLFVLSFTSAGQHLLLVFLGDREDLVVAAMPVMKISALAPLLIALQNGFQGFLIRSSLNKLVNKATIVGVCTMLVIALIAIIIGVSGAESAAWAMILGLSVEVCVLFYSCQKHCLSKSLESSWST